MEKPKKNQYLSKTSCYAYQKRLWQTQKSGVDSYFDLHLAWPDKIKLA